MYVRKIYRKSNISYPLIHTRTCTYQEVRYATFLVNCAYIYYGWSIYYGWCFCRCIDDYLANIQKKKLVSFGNMLQKKMFRKPILANLGTPVFKISSLLQTVVLLPGETNISKLFIALFIFISNLQYF